METTTIAAPYLQLHRKQHRDVPLYLNLSITWNSWAKKAACWWLDPESIQIGRAHHPKDHVGLLFSDANYVGAVN